MSKECKRSQIAVGATYGMLTVVGNPYIRYPQDGLKQKKTFVMCQCECGNDVEVAAYNLTRSTVSCGCIYGLSKHTVHHTWNGAKDRCFNKKSKNYKWYGGRGISMCDEWANDYKAFYDWSMSNGWATGLQLDRINNDGNYEPSNCRWVLCKINIRNKSTTKLNEGVVEIIKDLYLSQQISQKHIAKKYNIDQAQISRIINNKAWN